MNFEENDRYEIFTEEKHTIVVGLKEEDRKKAIANKINKLYEVYPREDGFKIEATVSPTVGLPERGNLTLDVIVKKDKRFSNKGGKHF